MGLEQPPALGAGVLGAVCPQQVMGDAWVLWVRRYIRVCPMDA